VAELVGISNTIAGAEFAVMPGCGHGFFWQKPEEVNKIIRDWLDRH
jgi:pimeloyl-ACP methyl ester carboxylesterase